MIKKVFKSRVIWFLLGGVLLPVIMRLIPDGLLEQIGSFAWSQKWGILIGIGLTILVNALRSAARSRKGKKPFWGWRIVRDDEEEEENTPFD